MTFAEILEHAEKRKWIRRKEWPLDSFLLLSITRRMLLDRSGDIRILKIEDYKADDWEVYEEREYFDFNRALELMESGEKVRSKAWDDIIIGYLYLSDNNEFCIEWRNEEEEKSRYYYNLKRHDLKAKDWYLVED